jgi:purine-binding chemotaxis protein CheW
MMQMGNEKFASSGSNDFLTFTLGHGEYGINIDKVQEIHAYAMLSRLARAADLSGDVTKLHGVIVPIVDIRTTFHRGLAEYSERSLVIILNVAKRVVGMLADGVCDVISLNADQIRPAHAYKGVIDTQYVMGVGTFDSRNLHLVDIEGLMSSRG